MTTMTKSSQMTNETRFRILPYKQVSKGAKTLATELGGLVLKLEDSDYTYKPGDVVINFGRGYQDSQYKTFATFLNPPEKILGVLDKRDYFRTMAAVCPDAIPRFWESQASISADAYPVACRTELEGKCGTGIVIAYGKDELVSSKLYVEFIAKTDEYRIHLGKKSLYIYPAGVFTKPQQPWVNEEIVLITEPRVGSNHEPEEAGWDIRNSAPSFHYQIATNCPDCVVEAAKAVFEASGLDFGAIDIAYDGKADRAYALEINTAPDLQGKTPGDYAKFFRSLV